MFHPALGGEREGVSKVLRKLGFFDTTGSGQVVQKKDVFKHLGSMEECRNALVIQMLVYAQLMNCAKQI